MGNLKTPLAARNIIDFATICPDADNKTRGSKWNCGEIEDTSSKKTSAFTAGINPLTTQTINVER
jgi:hypothetical protein